MNIPPVAALEIGTSHVRVLVGEAREDGHVTISGMGEVPSRGVRKGEVVEFDLALESVRSALHDAEERSPVKIGEVHLLVSGGEMLSMINRGSAPVYDSSEIQQEDIHKCLETARAVSLPTGRQLIHSIAQRYYIDDRHAVIDPLGMEGVKLSVDMLLLHGLRNRLRNTAKVVRSVPIEIRHVAFSGFCASLSSLTPEQKERGVLLIDMGGGTTDFVVYARNAIAWAGSLPVGGDHVTNDITHGLQVSKQQAEQLKESCGNALVDLSLRGQKISVPTELGVKDQFVPITDLHTIIHCRVEEIFHLIRNQLLKQELLHLLSSGVVLVGGGSVLKHVDVLGGKVFGMPCQVGKPLHFSGITTVTERPEYAAPLGMIRHGLSSLLREEQEKSPGRRLFEKFFSR